MLLFDWDDANLQHIALHAVRREEVEFALSGRTVDLARQDWHEEEERYVEVGVTASGRMLEIVTTFRGLELRVVTAYDAPPGAIKEYYRKVERL